MSDNQNVCGDSPRIEPTFEADPAKVDPPRLELLPYTLGRAGPRSGVSKAVIWTSSVAAALALVAGVAAATLYDHGREATLLAAKSDETRGLAQSIKALKDRIDAIEATRSRDESADARKIAAELKSQGAATRDLVNGLSQANARLDKLDREHSGKIDKLGDRLDHETTGKFADLNAKLADLGARIDKLEKRPPLVASAPVAAAPKPVAAAPAVPPPAARPTFAPANVSNETTGAIERPRLRGYWLVEADDSYAVIDGRDGPQQIAPGDILPGVGRVQRIERRSGGWVVVTTAGVIAGDQPY